MKKVSKLSFKDLSVMDKANVIFNNVALIGALIVVSLLLFNAITDIF